MTNSKKQSYKAKKETRIAFQKEEKRLDFVKTLKVQQEPKSVFIATPEGAAKRLAHKSRWHD